MESSDSLLGNNKRKGGHGRIAVMVIVGIVLLGAVIGLIVGLSGARRSPRNGNGGDKRVSNLTQCRYSTPDMVQWISGIDSFYRSVPGYPMLNLLYTCEFDFDFSPVYSKLAIFPVENNPDWIAANNLRKLALKIKADPAVTTLEKFQVDQGLADVEYYLNLSAIDHFVPQFASYNYDYSWLDDRIIAAVEMADTFAEDTEWGWCNGAIADWRAANPEGFEKKVALWLSNVPAMIRDYQLAFEHQLEVNKTHANITIAFQQWVWDEMFSHSFTAMCSVFTDTELAAQCAVDAADADAVMADFAAFFHDEYIPACAASRPDSRPGLTWVEDGDAAYEVLLRYHLGFERAAEDIYDMGVERVAANRAGMLETGNLIPPVDGFADFAALTAALSNSADSRFYFCNVSEDDVVSYYQALQSKIIGVVNDEFGYVPRVGARIGINGSPSTYNANGNYDQKRHFWTRSYVFNIGNEADDPEPNGCSAVYSKGTALSTTMHESFPGHGLQVPLQNEVSCQLSRYQYAPTAFIEGWALYVETTGYKLNTDIDPEFGLYSDPVQRLGQLVNSMLRNVRLEVDAGMNGNIESIAPWSYDEGWNEMVANGFTGGYAKSETQRYISMAGQATAYMTGRIKIEEMRAKAETELGDAFEPREFHNLLTRYGGASLGNLAALVDTYVAVKSSGLAASDASFNGLFAIDLVRQQFAGSLPVVGLGPV